MGLVTECNIYFKGNRGWWTYNTTFDWSNVTPHTHNGTKITWFTRPLFICGDLPGTAGV